MVPSTRASLKVVEVPASDLALEAGNVIAASMVMLGALSAATRSRVTRCAAVTRHAPACPRYRTQHLELNERALEIGAGALPGVMDEAWPAASTSGATRS